MYKGLVIIIMRKMFIKTFEAGTPQMIDSMVNGWLNENQNNTEDTDFMIHEIRTSYEGNKHMVKIIYTTYIVD